MGFGLGVLRLSPGDFWAATPRELMAAAHGPGAGSCARLPRGALDALMARFPDE